MPKPIHRLLVKQLEALGYRGSHYGMCYGIVCMAVQAILADDLVTFDERINLLKSYEDRKKLTEAIEAVKAKVKKQVELNDDDKKLLEVLAFYEGVVIYQHPKKNINLFDSQPRQESFLDVAAAAMPTILEKKKDDIKLLQQFTNIYENKSLKKLLDNLGKIVSKHTVPAPMIITANNHAVTVYYDKKNNSWVFIDPNHLPSQTISNTKELAKKIMRAFNLKGKTHKELCMNIEMYATQSLAQKPAKKLAKLAKKQIGTISKKVAIKELPDVEEKYETLLNLAACRGNVDVVNQLLKKMDPIDPQESIKDAIHFAIEFDQPEVFKQLLQYAFTDDQEKQDEFIKIACSKGSEKITRYLLELNPELIHSSSLLLHVAIKAKNEHIARLLIHHNIDLESTTYYGLTPILRAAERGYLSLVKLLIEKDVNTSVKDKEGYTLLAHAALSNNLQLVRYVIEKTKPAELNPTNRIHIDLITQLLTNSIHKEAYWKIAEYLLSKGAKLSDNQASRLRHTYERTIHVKEAQKLGYPNIAKLLTSPKASSLKQHTIFKQPDKPRTTETKSKKEILIERKR